MRTPSTPSTPPPPLPLLLLLLLPCVVAIPAARPQYQVLVNTTTGSLQGFVEQGSRKWLGVPYAEPPVGDRRWRPPAPKKHWGSAPRDATMFKPDCAQFGPGWPSLGITDLNTTSEDCLTLNVFAPLGTVAGGAPVVVFFPAGGYTWGAANDAEMNAYAKASAPGWQNVVFVTANYRVSIFGFLAHQSLRSRSPSGSTGCYGSQDQREPGPSFVVVFAASGTSFTASELEAALAVSGGTFGESRSESSGRAGAGRRHHHRTGGLAPDKSSSAPCP